MHSTHKLFCGLVVLLVGVLAWSRPAIAPAAADEAGSSAEAAGIVFKTLPSEDIDAIEKASGYRVGVLVADVRSGSPGAAAGIRAGDVVLIIGNSGVDSATSAVAAINASSGTVKVMALTQTEQGYTGTEYSLDLSAAASPGAGVPPQPAASAGWHLEALPNEALDKIQKESGYRVGVLVTQVEAGSPAALAGIQANDILMVVAKSGVDSPEAVERALAGQSGSVEVLALRPGQEKFEAVQCTVVLTGGSAATGGGGEIAAAVAAYFDMLDFSRTEAWGRPVITPAAERQRMAELLQRDWAGLNPQAQAAVKQIPEAWAALQKAWKGATEEKRKEQREYWHKQLLLPTQLFIPPSKQQTYRTPGDTVVFNYPSDWIGAQAEDKGVQYLYLGPPGTAATWQEVLNAAGSPPGALFTVAPMDEGMRAIKSNLEGARLLAGQFVTLGAADMKEIGALDLGAAGAIITLAGHFPGQKEEKFFWVGMIGFGSDNFIVGRCGGPTAQAETLVPAFGNMLVSLQLHPPGGAGGGYQPGEAAMAFDVASGIMNNAVLAEGWAGLHQ